MFFITRMLVSTNLLNNYIGAEQAEDLVAILKQHVTLKSLCGNKGNETELDMSSKDMGIDGAIMLAPEIIANKATTYLNLSHNKLCGIGIDDNTGLTVGNFDASGLIALAESISKCQ